MKISFAYFCLSRCGEAEDNSDLVIIEILNELCFSFTESVDCCVTSDWKRETTTLPFTTAWYFIFFAIQGEIDVFLCQYACSYSLFISSSLSFFFPVKVTSKS